MTIENNGQEREDAERIAARLEAGERFFYCERCGTISVSASACCPTPAVAEMFAAELREALLPDRRVVNLAAWKAVRTMRAN